MVPWMFAKSISPPLWNCGRSRNPVCNDLIPPNMVCHGFLCGAGFRPSTVVETIVLLALIGESNHSRVPRRFTTLPLLFSVGESPSGCLQVISVEAQSFNPTGSELRNFGTHNQK